MLLEFLTPLIRLSWETHSGLSTLLEYQDPNNGVERVISWLVLWWAGPPSPSPAIRLLPSFYGSIYRATDRSTRDPPRFVVENNKATSPACQAYLLCFWSSKRVAATCGRPGHFRLRIMEWLILLRSSSNAFVVTLSNYIIDFIVF